MQRRAARATSFSSHPLKLLSDNKVLAQQKHQITSRTKHENTQEALDEEMCERLKYYQFSPHRLVLVGFSLYSTTSYVEFIKRYSISNCVW